MYPEFGRTEETDKELTNEELRRIADKQSAHACIFQLKVTFLTYVLYYALLIQDQ